MSVAHLASGRGAHRHAACDSRRRYRDPIVVQNVGDVSCAFCRGIIRRVASLRAILEAASPPSAPVKP